MTVLERDSHPGGNCHTTEQRGIVVHEYGPHLFHTNSAEVWRFVNQFAEFEQYQHKVKALAGDGTMYTLPFCLETLQQMYGWKGVEAAQECIDFDRVICASPDSVEGFAMDRVGRKIYDLLIRGYTMKQWGRDPRDLPASIIKRIPLRFDWDDRYFQDEFQGVPKRGYTWMCESMLDHANIDVEYETEGALYMRDPLLYTGPIDALFEHRFGRLAYRTLRFEHAWHERQWVNGIGQLNYTSESVPWTREIEHKYFLKSSRNLSHSLVTREYAIEWTGDQRPYYPINDAVNDALYAKYLALSRGVEGLILGGRLGSYSYVNMDAAIGAALVAAKRFLKGESWSR